MQTSGAGAVRVSKAARILITGANGFVGRHLVHALRQSSADFYIIAACNGRYEDSLADEIIDFDLEKTDRFESIIDHADPDAIVHLAAETAVPATYLSPLDSWQKNLIATVALGEATLKHKRATRLIFASSSEVYGHSFNTKEPVDETALLLPASPYGAAKAAADQALGEMSGRGLNAVRLRMFNHTGPGQSQRFVLPAFCRKLSYIRLGKTKPTIKVGSLDHWRDFFDVRDACAAYIAALDPIIPAGAVFNIGSGVARSVGDILESLISKMSLNVEVIVDQQLVRQSGISFACANASLARTELNWRPRIEWETTLDDLIAYWLRKAGTEEY